MTEGIHDIDGAKVFLGFDRGAVANVRLPEIVTSYARKGPPYFPEFTGRFAPCDGAELVAAVCWNSVHQKSLGLPPAERSYSGFCDIRHAYFLARSPVLKWTWLLSMLAYDDDNETWEWWVVAATDRDVEGKRDAARWLLETFWHWDAARIGHHATPIEEVGASGLLSADDIRQLGASVFPA